MLFKFVVLCLSWQVVPRESSIFEIMVGLAQKQRKENCVDGVEKVGIPLLLLATLAAVLFNSNRGSILAFVQFNSTAEQMRLVANVPNNPFVMHSYLTLSCLSHLHMYGGP